jgi:hypothetical protein
MQVFSRGTCTEEQAGDRSQDACIFLQTNRLFGKKHVESKKFVAQTVAPVVTQSPKGQLPMVDLRTNSPKQDQARRARPNPLLPTSRRSNLIERTFRYSRDVRRSFVNDWRRLVSSFRSSKWTAVPIPVADDVAVPKSRWRSLMGPGAQTQLALVSRLSL